MKSKVDQVELDGIDIRILRLLQERCKMPLAKIGAEVGLSAPAVVERVRKLEESGVIVGYRAVLDARKLGCDITAFIGVSIVRSRAIPDFEGAIRGLGDVLECHHVTGGYTFLLKVKTTNASSLEDLISRIRLMDGVAQTETMVVLSTHTERTQVPLRERAHSTGKRKRRNGADPVAAVERV